MAKTILLMPPGGYKLPEGDRFTIEGWGTSARGHQVIAGRSAKTGRKMKVKRLQEFVVTGVAVAPKPDHR